MLIQTKQIEPIPNSALVSDAKVGSLSSLPFSASSCTDAISQLYTSLHNLSFLSLTDTPNSYSGQGYKFARVNSTETALQFSSIRENNAGNVGIGYSGSLSSLATKLYVDDSSSSVDYGIFINKNYGFTALTVNAGAGATGLDVAVDGAGGDILRLSGQYSPAIVAKYNGRLGVGTSSPGYRLHTAWRSGDTGSTSYFGAGTSGNNQVAIDAETYSATAAIRGNNATGTTGVHGISAASGSFGVYGQSLTAGGIKASGQVYGAYLESAGKSLYVHNGSIQFTPLAGTGTRMLNVDSTGIVGAQSLPLSSAITSLNSLTAANQTFVNDTNVTMTSAGTAHSLGWAGNLAIARGGTNAATANAAINNLLPVQTANAGKYLYSDGINTSWKNFPRPSQTRFVSGGFSGLSAPYYTTVQAAIDDAASGDLVEVFAGTYNEHITLKDQVNLYVHTGVRIRYASTMYHTVYANNVSCIIDGFGIFEHDAASSLSVIGIDGNSNITLRCKRLHMMAGYQTIAMTDGKAIIRADEIISDENVESIRVTGGALELSARIIKQSLDNIGVISQTGGVIRISNTRIESLMDAPPGLLTSVRGVIYKEAGTLLLNNCTIVNPSTYTPAYSIGAATTQDVKVYHCVANKPAHPNINFIVQSITVDSDVS